VTRRLTRGSTYWLCARCGIGLPRTAEWWTRDASVGDGLSVRCKRCTRRLSRLARERRELRRLQKAHRRAEMCGGCAGGAWR